eukprot:TRINITY_DN48143_c0_g1_i1.p1 TRINITY_DN48143_c0_g1~~TRINITY_DN48143_c0_g1_i1.p1  ORF type:complete len:375 (+),score=120.52 TRINITY_DN48143_c0_g1_i1:86-1126(+)
MKCSRAQLAGSLPTGKLSSRNSGLGWRRDSWLEDYVSTPKRPVMWRVYMRDDQETRKHEELFQQWKGVLDFPYRRPHGQIKHPAWLRRLFAEKKQFELEPETNTERIYLGFTAHYLWSHWSRRGAVCPPVEVLQIALDAVQTPKDLGYATKMLRLYRQHFNVHLEHDTFSAYMNAALRAGCPDCALYALHQARWLGFATVKEADREFLLGKAEGGKRHDWDYEEHVAQPLAALAGGNPHEEPIAEKEDFSPFAKFWRTHENEQGWWVFPWDKDPNTRVLKHYWRHPKNVDPRYGTQYTEWTAAGTPLATDAHGAPQEPLGEAAARGATGTEGAEADLAELGRQPAA